MPNAASAQPSKVPPRPGTKPAAPSRKQAPGGAPPERDHSRRLSARQAMQARRRRLYMAGGATAVVVAAIAVLLTVSGTSGGGKSTGNTGPVAGVFAVSPKTLAPLEKVSGPTLLSAATRWHSSAVPPTALPASNPALALDGKPEVLYIGANYCPYCAAERWPLFMALSKFGTFSGLRGTASSSSDINASTPTITFLGSTYASRYVSFVSVETHGSEVDASGSYPVLQHMTAEQTALLTKWDAPPYVPSSAAGGIPFVYIGGRYVFIGSQYDGAHIAGWNFDRAAAYLASPSNSVGRSVRAAAGYLVRDICHLTGNRPASACG